ncbi:citryl-CoA lyase [Pigmentiphaga sp. GD03639]|uniref:citrate synthase (unknown stereospecificity) n=1 Tax=Pigmentiphaga daeguensis TaxID=414049 RepID=A0ABP3MCG7_9BURK|nr:citryl-CoA lyase [Pigmentiphaga sp. GD03639]MDH2236345.1 citryl-CoA lyase [Pigmentiphaga sp. GD03639]
MADRGAEGPYTHTGYSDATSVRVRGKDLINELVGHCSFTEMLYFLTCGRMPQAGQVRVLDACLVTLMEHGLTPSAVIARLMADSVPEEPQVAVASGLLAIGSVFAGTTENCARLLLEIEAAAPAEELEQAMETRVARLRGQRLPAPGFGHATHKPDDPRTPRLLQVAREAGQAGRYVALLEQLGGVVDRVYGRHLTINATGAMGALFLEIGIPVEAMRCYSVVSRAGGLVGHLLEERAVPSARMIWRMSKQAVPYREPPESV